MKLSVALVATFLSVLFAISEVSAQQPYCYSFESLDGFTYGSYAHWKYSIKERPKFFVPPSDDGYIWTRYLSATNYKPQIVLPVQRRISQSTTFSLRYYLNQITNNITINFLRSSDNARIRLGLATTNNSKNVSTWLTYSGTCKLCCEVDVETCTGQFEIIGTYIFNATELALSSFSINNGSCAQEQPTSCSEFDSWGKWTNVQNWSLSKDGPLHPSLPSRDRNYAWVDTTNPLILNLTSPFTIGVTMNTRLSLDYFVTDSASTIKVYFMRGNNFSAIPQLVSQFAGAVENEWDHRVIKCQLPSGYYCCGIYPERCSGYFLFEIASNSNGIIALDDVGVNTPDCGMSRTSQSSPGFVVEEGGIAGRGKGRFNLVQKDERTFFSFSYNF